MNGMIVNVEITEKQKRKPPTISFFVPEAKGEFQAWT
jgi:hypothetical protein